MLKELIGAVATFFVMLPFLFLNRRVFKVRKQGRFAVLFLLCNMVQAAFLLLLAYGLFTVGQECLYGMLGVFIVFFFMTLLLLITSKRKIVNTDIVGEEDEEFDELFSEENFTTKDFKGSIKKEIENKPFDDILMEDQYTMKVEEPDFSKIEKTEVMRTLEDIFKEK